MAKSGTDALCWVTMMRVMACSLANDILQRAPGGTQLFLGGCLPHGYLKVGSRERIFLEKCGVLGTEI